MKGRYLFQSALIAEVLHCFIQKNYSSKWNTIHIFLTHT